MNKNEKALVHEIREHLKAAIKYDETANEHRWEAVRLARQACEEVMDVVDEVPAWIEAGAICVEMARACRQREDSRPRWDPSPDSQHRKSSSLEVGTRSETGRAMKMHRHSPTWGKLSCWRRIFWNGRRGIFECRVTGEIGYGMPA